MDAEDFDIYPIVHEGKVYNIITPFDMTFPEVHAMLSYLEEQGAFRITPDDERLGPGKFYSLSVLGVAFEVDVQGYEVIVFKRSD